MHVADITLFFAPHSGGVKRYLLAKHRHFNAQVGLRHSLIVPGRRDAEIEPAIFEMKSPRIPFGGGYRIPWRVDRWRSQLNRLSPDVIEAGDPYHLAWTALRSAADLRIPAVAFAHSDMSRVLASHVARSAGPIADAYLRKLYARFDLVMAPSRSIARRLHDIGVERVVVQPLGVDGDTFTPTRRDPNLRAELGLADDVRLLIFAGRMAPEKQIPLLIDAFALLGDRYHLLLVGAETRSQPARNVTVLPYEQDSAGLARLIASADALAHAGAHETFGLIAIEAMACGIPVVGVRSGALGELIDDVVGVLADGNDAGSFARAVEKLYSRNLRKMGLSARAKVDKAYTWKSIFDRQIERYRHLIGRGDVPIYDETEVAGAQ
ncbi:MAG: glycosyltransferase [Rudaea sp.]